MEHQTSVEVARLNAAPRKRPSRLRLLADKFKRSFDVSLFISILISLAMLIIGAIKYHDCPVQKNIPVFLIAFGIIGILSKLVTWGRNWIAGWKLVKISTIITTIYTVEITFFIYGSYWVYKVYPPSYDHQDREHYCDKTAYLFAFIYITIYYVFLLIFVIGILCFVCGIFACEKWISNLEEEDDAEAGDVDKTVASSPTQTDQHGVNNV